MPRPRLTRRRRRMPTRAMTSCMPCGDPARRNSACGARQGCGIGDGWAGHDVLFVDARIEDASSLLAHVRAGTDVVYLQQARRRRRCATTSTPIRARPRWRFIAHGNDGDLWLGNTYLSGSNIADHAADLQQIGADIQAGGDILIYACDTAAGAKGLSFVTSLADLTHRDVAASSNRTGAGATGTWKSLLEPSKLAPCCRPRTKPAIRTTWR